MNLENEFVPYEQALALKELGFDELCFGWYQHKLIVDKEYSILEFEKCKNKESWITGNHCSAPTYSQAFRLFREKYDIYYVIEGSKKFGFQHTIYDEKETYEIKSEKTYNTYEEAELECLKKLIEIVKDAKK